MADYTIVDQVTRALEGLLTATLFDVDPANPPSAQRHNLKPPPAVNPPILTLFLYEIVEDPTVRNRPAGRTFDPAAPVPAYRLTKTPMPLILRYLMTPWAPHRETEHLMIGRTMQVLYEQQIHRGAELTPELAVDALSVTLAPLTLEERTRVWWSVQEPYRLSVNYEVRVVNLDVRPQSARLVPAVRERELRERRPAERS